MKCPIKDEYPSVRSREFGCNSGCEPLRTLYEQNGLSNTQAFFSAYRTLLSFYLVNAKDAASDSSGLKRTLGKAASSVLNLGFRGSSLPSLIEETLRKTREMEGAMADPVKYLSVIENFGRDLMRGNVQGVNLSPDQVGNLSHSGGILAVHTVLRDAVEDLEKDRKSGQYNPFRLMGDSERQRVYAESARRFHDVFDPVVEQISEKRVREGKPGFSLERLALKTAPLVPTIALAEGSSSSVCSSPLCCYIAMIYLCCISGGCGASSRRRY